MYSAKRLRSEVALGADRVFGGGGVEEGTGKEGDDEEKSCALV